MPYYKYRREIPTKRNQRAVIGKQVMMVGIILMMALMAVLLNNTKSVEGIETLPYTSELAAAENFHSVQIGIHEEGEIVVNIKNKGGKTLYWEIYPNKEMIGDCIDSGFVNAVSDAEIRYDHNLEPGIYSFLFFNDGSEAVKGTFTIEYEEDTE